MSNEISYELSLYLTNGLLTDRYTVNTINMDQTTAKLVRNVQSISASTPTALDMGDLDSVGMALFLNMGPTNYVDIGRMVTTKLVTGTLSPDVSGVWATSSSNAYGPIYQKIIGGTTWYICTLYEMATWQVYTSKEYPPMTGPGWTSAMGPDGTYDPVSPATGALTVTSLPAFFVPMMRLAYGQYSMCQLSPDMYGQLYAQAHTAEVELFYIIYNP